LFGVLIYLQEQPAKVHGGSNINVGFDSVRALQSLIMVLAQRIGHKTIGI